MAREILKFYDKKKSDPQTKVFRSQEIVGFKSGDLVYLSDMQSDGSQAVKLTFSASVKINQVTDNKIGPELKSGSTINLTDVKLIVVNSNKISAKAGDQKITFEFFNAIGEATWSAEITLSVVRLVLLADFNRDGAVDSDSDESKMWAWGANGKGAILLVNSDRDTSYPSPYFRDRLDHRVNGPLDLEDMTRMRLEFSGPKNLDLVGYSIRLHVSDAAASRMRIFDVSTQISEVLIEQGLPLAVLPPHYRSWEIAIEGIDYPDAAFSGLVSIFVDFEKMGVQYSSDKVVLRVAPWIATPNSQPAKRVYIAEMEDGSNAAAIEGITQVCKAASVELVVVPPKINRKDRWLQDEIEIGYAERPGKRFSVVLDSPRNRQLDDFTELMILGPDFAYVTRGNDEERSSLDSFGNLDCTPPHTGSNGSYPLGRIIFGGAQPGAKKGRRMMKVVSDFLYAQKIQSPIELFSDWLSVGHVDEFMSFVPTQDKKKFRLVLASPYTAFEILEKLSTEGYESSTFMKDKRFEQSIAEFLAKKELRQQNEAFQKFIDWNKAVLVREMGLNSNDIIYLPALYFSESSDGRAGAYFPGMVNMQVINNHLAIPKPFGPIIDGECALEKYVKNAFEPLGLNCHFVDTYEGYHLGLGEIHCGTNVVREPFNTPWWHLEPQSPQD
jgi:protein-arginine deiminase